MNRIITAEQKRRYEEDGYVLVPDLIAPEIVERATAALWRELNADPNDAATWNDLPRARGFKDADIVACFTPQFQQAAAELAGESVSAPSSAFMLNVFPQEGPWKPQGPHIDHAIPKDNFRVFPRPMRVASIAYLNEVPLHGASTVVWPGSFKKIEALAQSDPEKYALMAALNADLRTLELGDPVEISGKRGAALFYHYLTAHAGSSNATQTPRLAIVHKW